MKINRLYIFTYDQQNFSGNQLPFGDLSPTAPKVEVLEPLLKVKPEKERKG